MYYHFRHDWRRAGAVMMLFLLTGVAIVVYLNQSLGQPRERDYSYVGSFFAFALWIGFGAHALLEGVAGSKSGRSHLQIVMAGLLIIFVPANLFRHNFHTHDRQGNYAASDYAFNLLNSCEANAILFTNGDNDTFPLWYLQQVEGLRRDVSVVNLSLLNTNWYIRQLKNRAPQVPMSLSDSLIDSIGILDWPDQRIIGIPLENEPAFQKYLDEVENFAPVKSLRQQGRAMQIEIGPTYARRFLRVQDLMIFEIVAANQFRRAIYFGFNVPSENHAGLTPYLRTDGMALKLMPFQGVQYSPEALRHHLLEVYRYRGLNDPAVFLDDQAQGLAQSYRANFLALAWHYLNTRQRQEARALLRRMDEIMPETVLPLNSTAAFLHIGNLYAQAGDSAELARRLNYALRHFELSAPQKLETAALYWKTLGDSSAAESLAKAAFAEHPEWGQAEKWLEQLAREKNEPARTARE
jgi:tetratricopeptide (TPR) repeat protein